MLPAQLPLLGVLSILVWLLVLDAFHSSRNAQVLEIGARESASRRSQTVNRDIAAEALIAQKNVEDALPLLKRGGIYQDAYRCPAQRGSIQIPRHIGRQQYKGVPIPAFDRAAIPFTQELAQHRPDKLFVVFPALPEDSVSLINKHDAGVQFSCESKGSPDGLLVIAPAFVEDVAGGDGKHIDAAFTRHCLREECLSGSGRAKNHCSGEAIVLQHSVAELTSSRQRHVDICLQGHDSVRVDMHVRVIFRNFSYRCQLMV